MFLAELDDTVTHGDELAYLFDVNDIYGNSVESENAPLTKDDQKVRDIFTQMVADFARTGKVRIENRDVSPFSATSNNFIQIKPKPVLANDFKYCEMALWCNIAERLKSSACSFLKAFDQQLKNVGKIFGGVLQGTNILDANNGGLHNILTGGSQSNQKSETPIRQNPLAVLFPGRASPMSNMKQNRRPAFPNIGGLVG